MNDGVTGEKRQYRDLCHSPPQFNTVYIGAEFNRTPHLECASWCELHVCLPMGGRGGRLLIPTTPPGRGGSL